MASLVGFDPAALLAFEESLRLPPTHAPITPVSSPEDPRQYRVITLANGLTALLISDPTTDKAAASLDVNVGSFADPSDTLGLAHFLEHMLFMGTEKYPDENSYSLAINNYGGSQNAYTTRENTNYIFDVSKDHLREVLDRFAQFFVAPLCLRSAVDRELNAVNNEHEKNLQSDYWRMAHLSESALNPAHPIAQFSTGNFLTLRDQPKAAGIDTRERLMEFYHTHYSANLMKLCVVGKEDLDTLAQWVSESFSDVKNIGRQRPSYLDIPIALPGVHTTTITRVVPVKNYRHCELEFVFPPTHHQYLAEPTALLVHCLAHEATGSLAHYLKEHSYVNSLVANQLEQNSSYSMGRLELELTELGLAKIDDILELTFAYIHMLRDSLESQPDVWRNEIWPEVQAVERMDFRFAEKTDPIDFAEQHSARLHILPAKHVLSGGCLETYDEPTLKAMANVFANVQNVRVRIVAPEFKSLPNLKSEQWYGTLYTSELMSPELLERCKHPKPVAEFKLPKMNPFIATDFALKHPQRTEEQKKAGVVNPQPKRIQCCGGGGKPIESTDVDGAHNHAVPLATGLTAELFYVPDRTFELPKVDVCIHLTNHLAHSSPAAKSITSLWCDLVDDALSELNHFAEEAGIGSYSWPNNSGLTLRYNGFAHKMRLFIETLLPKLRSIRARERVDQFTRLKEQMFRKLTQYKKDTPLSHARDDSNQLRQETYWSVDDQLATFDTLTPELIDEFISNWFRQGQLYVLVNGSMTEQEAIDLTVAVQQAFAPLAPLPTPQQYSNRCVELPSTHTYVHQAMSKNADDTNSCCLNVYQIGVAHECTDAHMALLSHILADALFDQLRTKETLGYLVHGYQAKTLGVLHYHIAVQSSDASAAYLNCRIEAFLQWFRESQFDALVKETPDFLERNKQAVILQLTEKDKNLRDEHNRLWGEISKQRFDWARRERVAKEVAKVTQASFWGFYDRYISASGRGSDRRKVSFQYNSAQHSLPARIERETPESVAFGNEKLVVKNAKPAADEEAAASPSSAASPAAPAEEVFLPSAVVDPRPIRYIDDIVRFKREQRLYPAML